MMHIIHIQVDYSQSHMHTSFSPDHIKVFSNSAFCGARGNGSMWPMTKGEFLNHILSSHWG